VTSTQTPPRDNTKHEWEFVPIVGGVHKYPARYVGQWKREETGQRKAIVAARDYIAAHEDVERCHIYHTHPSPGPVSRYCGIVTRDGKFRQPN
jgi:hypothetical protein